MLFQKRAVRTKFDIYVFFFSYVTKEGETIALVDITYIFYGLSYICIN